MPRAVVDASASVLAPRDVLAGAKALKGVGGQPYSPPGDISRAGGLGSSHSAFARIAEERGVGAQQVSLSWELAK
ncbi:hypothetical protein [Streptomyces sp. NBC_00322]|uniref:hypothetical protein n=1 Tax=Streptomyces sp. NBC_00322 TaxID=2975712 RepID=UPI003FA7400C